MRPGFQIRPTTPAAGACRQNLFFSHDRQLPASNQRLWISVEMDCNWCFFWCFRHSAIGVLVFPPKHQKTPKHHGVLACSQWYCGVHSGIVKEERDEHIASGDVVQRYRVCPAVPGRWWVFGCGWLVLKVASSFFRMYLTQY